MSAEVDAIVATVTADPEWATNPSGFVSRYTTLAADRLDSRVTVGKGSAADAALNTHVACALVVAAANPAVTRGAVLDDLVARYGNGGYGA